MRHTNIAYNRREAPPTAGTGHAHAHHGPSMQPPTDFVTYRTTPRRPGPGARCPNCVALTEPQYSFRTYEYNTMTGYKFAPAAVLLINKVQPTSTNLFTFVALCCAFTSPSWRHPCRHWRRRSGSVPAYSLFARRDCAGHCHMTRLTSAPPNHHGRTCHSRLRRSFIVTQAYQITMPFISENSLLQPTEEEDQARSIWQFRELVSWSLMSLFGTNVAISDTKGQGWKAIPTQWRKASDILT